MILLLSVKFQANKAKLEVKMAQYIYTMNHVSKIVPPKKEILHNISLSFFPGAKIGVLGLNGSGKSTLLKIMAGIDKDIQGEAFSAKGISIGYLPQEPQLDETKTVKENIELGLGDIKAKLNRFNEISDKFAEPMDDDTMNNLLTEQGELQSIIEAAGGWEIDRKLEISADALRLPPWEQQVKNLSGGERRRVALCKLLLSNPDMLLLDEPTNHLDAESVAWLEHFLQEFPGTVVAVTHDRYFLDNAAGWILELDRGRGIPYEGNYTNWLEQKDLRLQQEQKTQSSLDKMIKSELEWVKQSPKGRRAKNKARVNRYNELISQETQDRGETQSLYIPPGPRLGELVIKLDNISKSYNDTLLIDKLSLQVPKGAIVGIIGANGAGKSTTFKMLTGQVKPDSGTVTLGETVKLSYVDQSRDNLDPNKTVWEEVSDGLDFITVDNYQVSSRAYLGRFNFKGTDQQKRVGDLSGGERNRLHLAKLLKSGGNVLLLDEPTNDLDIETLRALEEALLVFPGCVMVISHDRWFLDRISTHIMAFEGDSHVEWFEGNYSEYEAKRKEELGEDFMQPHRIKYKKIETIG